MDEQPAKSILDTQSLQDKFQDVQVAAIIGQLYTEGIVTESLKNDVNATDIPSKKRKLLFKHLCKQNVTDVKTFCKFLCTSADSIPIPAHKRVADEILKAIDNPPVHIVTADLAINAKRGATSRDLTPDIHRKRFCNNDAESDCAYIQVSSRSTDITVNGTRRPQDTSEDGISQWIDSARQMRGKEHCEQLAIAWPAALGKIPASSELRRGQQRCLVSEMRKLRVSSAEASLEIAQKLMKYKGTDLSFDSKISAVQAVLPSCDAAIPLFKKLLEWCKTPDCLNPITLGCRVHYRLVWCYHRAKNSEKAMEHALEAKWLANFVSDDFGSAQADSYYARLEYRRTKANLSEEKILELEDCHDRVLQKVGKLERWMHPLLVRAVLEVAMHKAVSSEFYLKRDQPSAVRLQLRAAQRILNNIEEEYGGTLENADLAYFYQISCIVSKLNGQLERARELGEKSVTCHEKCGRHGDAAEVRLLLKEINSDIEKVKECLH